jgi:hypothetical protein
VHIGSADNWRTLGVIILVSGGIALASMAVVRLRNVNRGDTTAVEWALDDLRAIPEYTLSPVCQPADFLAAVDRYRGAVRRHSVPVDSIREFYQLYARLARDGSIDSREVSRLGPYLGFPVRDSSGADGPER